MHIRHLAVLIASVALLILAACSNNGDDGESRPTLSGAVYLLKDGSLVRVDLADQEATEAHRFSTTGLRQNAVVADDRLFFADVIRDGTDWLPILHVLDRKTGEAQPPITLDPVQDAASASEAGGPLRFSLTHDIRVSYLPRSGLVIVGIAETREETASYRLDVIDARELSLTRSIDLGEAPGRGGISIATDSSGNVAVLLGNSRMNQLLVSSGSLSAFKSAGTTDCGHGLASSTARALRRYFLCFGPGQTASLLVFDGSGAAERQPLPGEFFDPLFGVADAGGSVFIGNAQEATVIEFDLVSQQVVAERQVSRQKGSSFLGQMKDLFLGGKAMAIEVVRRPVAVSPDGERVYFTDRRNVYCLQAQNLEPVGDAEFESVRSLASWNDDKFLAAGETTLHVLDAACKPEASIDIPFDTRGPPEEIFAP